MDNHLEEIEKQDNHEKAGADAEGAAGSETARPAAAHVDGSIHQQKHRDGSA
jgi:hypothetical protein